MIAKVIPALKMPRALRDFDYRIEGDFSVHRGSLVLIPWRNKPTLGVVTAVTEGSDVPEGKLKPISAVLTDSRLPEDLMLALEWAADRYLTSLGTMARCFLPDLPKRRQKLVAPLSPIAEKDQTALPGKWGFVKLYGSPSEKWSSMEQRVERCLDGGRTAIVLLPHQSAIREAAGRLKAQFGDRVAEIHGDQSTGALWRGFEAALSGQASVVVGSRMAAMAPLQRLGLVLIMEADSQDHKQYDQNPRYDARALAKVRTEAAGAELVVMTQSPRVEDFLLLDGEFTLEESATEPAPVVLADVSGTGTDWNGPLSPVSLERIRESLQNGKNALIYHNRQGTAGALACGDCRAVSRCPNCVLAMPIRGEQLHCRRCGLTVPTPVSCPNCGGVRLRPIGFGTAAVESFLRKHIPEADVIRADAENGRLESSPTGKVLIGSRALIHDLAEIHEAEFGAVIVTAAEDLLRHPGFRATEEAWGLIQKLRYLAARGRTDLVLQTLNVEDMKVRSLTRDAQPFLQEETETRRGAGYPPVGRLVLIISRGRTETEALAGAERARIALQVACRTNGPQTVLSRPFLPSQPLSHGTWRQAIAIRTPIISEGLQRALRELPEEWVIDPDPETPL